MNPKTNIVLTGFMGTGKSTIGRLLARVSDREFVDTDALVEEVHGPISGIFADGGEAQFRQFERDVVGAMEARHGLVVATGGGTLLDPANRRALGASGQIICLTASADTVLNRVLNDPSRPERPLLAGAEPGERIAALMAERAPLYARFPQVTTDGRTPAQVVAEIQLLIAT